MAPFRHWLKDERLWSIRRRTVVPAVAAGLFIAFLPVPGHILLGVLAGLSLRVNIPVAVLATWVANPLTMGPMYFLAYRFGQGLLGLPVEEFQFELSWDWVSHTFVTLWQPMLLGCVLLGSAAALIGYVTLDVLWRFSIADYKTRKREKRSERDS